MQVAKTRLAVSSAGTCSGPLSLMAGMARVEGVRALYKGCGTSVVGVRPPLPSRLLRCSLSGCSSSGEAVVLSPFGDERAGPGAAVAVDGPGLGLG